MVSSDDEQDDGSAFDQLKSIKPFTIDQLYLLHPDVGCPPTQTATPTSDTRLTSATDHEVYQNLIEYEQLRFKLSELKNEVKKLHKKTFEHVDKAWVFKERANRKIAMCQQGKIAETTFKYKQAYINPKQLDSYGMSFSQLSELINKDYMYYSFESQMKRNKISTQLSIAYQIPDIEARKDKLKPTISTLVDFIRHLGDSKSEFVLQCRKWLRGLIKRFLDNGTTQDYRFVVAQLSRGPSGTSDWASDLIECKPFGQVDGFNSVPQYITHCSALLGELFNNLKSRVRRVTLPTSDNTDSANPSDQNWSLIDPRFNCSEELNLSATSTNVLSECDVIKICLKIPVAQIFRAYVKKCLVADDACLETDKNYEYIMLKLLTIGTIIIKTYQIGLETFNSIQYGNLIEYLSSQIRRTVIVLSDQWTEFKSRLKGIDDALLMRLQVEYDNFILRSILVILELRQSGIWRHLSRIEQDSSREHETSASWSTDSIRPAFAKLLQVTGLTPHAESASTAQTTEVLQTNQFPPSKDPNSSSLTYEFSVEWFKEVSEPMLWHILWQFYHNAFVSSCDYHSDNYWLDKFKGNSVVYLFVKKIRDSPPGECSYLLNSITSMVLSRTRPDSMLVNFTVEEIFNLSFKQPTLKDKVTKKGIRSLTRCAEKFPNLISLYINLMCHEDLDNDIVELFKGCSLVGWLFNDEELSVLAKWLVEYPLTSNQNKLARLIISKVLLNSPESREQFPNYEERRSPASKNRRPSRITTCFVDLKLRRRLALLLYDASVHHLPVNHDFGAQSLGASVEVAFGTLYCEKNAAMQNNLIELSIDTSYQQFYVWAWRLLFTSRLHILNQTETDWNDVQSRSGTSRSIKNTVLFNDSFHPAPSIEDSECLALSEGIRKQNSMAAFIYLVMTDATWQVETLNQCLDNLLVLAESGHLTPSLMAMKYLTICHLNDLLETVAKDKRSHEYFTKIITSNYDATRLASLIMSQLDHLKQYRQLQLSQYYITVLFEVGAILSKQISSSWFSGGDHSLEKIACLLDYIVKFNFGTQRLEIIRKFYDCSYSIQGNTNTSNWLGSFFTSNSLNANSTRREFLTISHVLIQRFKKYTWLRWVTTECDTLRLEKIWEDIVSFLSSNEDATLDSAMKKVCPQVNASILKTTLPIFSWIRQIFDIMESDLNHPLCPIIWYNFFLNYFANSLNGVSVGYKLIPPETQTKLMSRLDSLFNYHIYKQRNWALATTVQQNSLSQLYRAYKLWLQDASLRDAYVDIDRLRDDYIVPLLKAVMESTTEGACIQFVDLQGIETQNKNLMQVWNTATHLEGNRFIKDMIFVDSNIDESMDILTSVDDEASDAASLIMKPYQNAQPEGGKALLDSEDELKKPIREELLGQTFRTYEEIMETVKKNFHLVIEESSLFGFNLIELDKTKSEITELIQHLYINKKREFVRVVPCAEGNECIGPVRIKLEVEEAYMDERRSQCIQDRRRQCQELIGELLLMPSGRTVQSTVVIEENIKQLISDPVRSKTVIESLLKWINEPNVYDHLNGSYYAANHLFKIVLEILSTNDQVDTYNSALIEICLAHPNGVQIFSPHLSPSSCSPECFLSLYKIIGSSFDRLTPMAMFVLLSKFDINSWLSNIRKKEMQHDLIRTTCEAFRGLGKYPDESLNLTFDLYKRHLQVELASPDRRKPEEILLVLEQFLTIMDQQSLALSLWTEFLNILGLDLTNHKGNKSMNKSMTSTMNKANTSIDSVAMVMNTSEHDETTVASLIEDVARLAECQMIFDYHSLNNLMLLMNQVFNSKHESNDVTLLELYSDYLDRFSIVMLSVVYMWLKSTSEHYPDNHVLIWNQFMNYWNHWVFISKNCQNVGKSNYSLVANYFVASIRYMISRIPDDTQAILQSVLSTLVQYVSETKEVVYLELTILQRSLKNLPWSSFLPDRNDFERLASLSEQENYNISDLISHIITQINLKDSLSRLNDRDPDSLPIVTERLATTIVLQSNHLKFFRLHAGRYFTLVPVDRIPEIVKLILQRMEFLNLEHSQRNKLLVNLLRSMCIKLDDTSIGNDNLAQSNNKTDSFERSLIYARFVSSYLIDLIKNHPSVVRNNQSYLYAVMDNSLQDLKILLTPDLDLVEKTTLYEGLLECCSNEIIDSESRMVLARSLVDSQLLKNRPIVVLEVLYAIGQIIRDGRVLAYMTERLIIIYLQMNGHYEKVLKSFCLKVLPSDIYLNACIEENSSLALLVYFESISRNDNTILELGGDKSQINEQSTVVRLWSSFFHWLSQMTINAHVKSSGEIVPNESKTAIVWLKMLDLFEKSLQHYVLIEVHHPSKSIAEDSSKGESTSESETTKENGIIEASSPKDSTTIATSHKSLIEFIKQLISLYDSYNSGGLWSYLKASTRSDQSARISIIALAIASFLSNRLLSCLNENLTNEMTKSHLTALRDEMLKHMKVCLIKLEAARRSKYFITSTQFIETLIESVQRNDKVQYSEGVQLITNYVMNTYLSSSSSNLSDQHNNDTENCAYMSKILASFTE